MHRRFRTLVAFALSAALMAVATPSAGGATTADDEVATAPKAVEPRWGDTSSPIRPGAPLAGGCTFNWIFYEVVEPTQKNPAPVPDVYIGTAAHCTEKLGERVIRERYGPVGTVVYDSDILDKDVDFSLVQIDPSLVSKTNPQMYGWDGPRGVVSTSMLEAGDRVDVHGYGIGVGLTETTRSRFGILVGWSDKEYVADMPAVNGDSGAPLLHHGSGHALGIISRYGFEAMPPSTDTGPLVPWILEELHAAGFDLRLATIR